MQSLLMTEIMLCVLKEFSLAMEEKRYEQLLPLMERAKADRLYEVHVLLQLGHQCLEKPSIPCKPAARVAFSAALQLMLEQRESPSVAKLVKVIISFRSTTQDLQTLIWESLSQHRLTGELCAGLPVQITLRYRLMSR